MTTTPKISMKILDEAIRKREEESNNRFDAVEETVATVDNKMDELLNAVRNMAKNNPTSIRPDGVLSTDLDAQENLRDIEFKDGRPGDDVELLRSGRSFESVDSPEFKSKAERLRFDAEKIRVRVMGSSNPYPDNTFTLGVNGRLIMMVRGAEQEIPRCYAEVMAKAKTSTYGNVEGYNASGEKEVRNPETRAARYPFQVLWDPNPLGPKWYERVTNDPM